MRDDIDLAVRRVIWAAVGIACTAPVIWLWSGWVARNDARLMLAAERQAMIEMCREENAVAVLVLNSDKITCVSGSGRSLTAPLRHPLKGSK